MLSKQRSVLNINDKYIDSVDTNCTSTTYDDYVRSSLFLPSLDDFLNKFITSICKPIIFNKRLTVVYQLGIQGFLIPSTEFALFVSLLSQIMSLVIFLCFFEVTFSTIYINEHVFEFCSILCTQILNA